MLTRQVLKNLTQEELGHLADSYAWLAYSMQQYNLTADAKRAQKDLLKIFEYVPESSVTQSVYCDGVHSRYTSYRKIFKQAGYIMYYPSGVVTCVKCNEIYRLLLEPWEPKNKSLVRKAEKFNDSNRDEWDITSETAEEVVSKELKKNAAAMKKQLTLNGLIFLKYQIAKRTGKKFYVPKRFKTNTYNVVQEFRDFMKDATLQQYKKYISINRQLIEDILKSFYWLFSLDVGEKVHMQFMLYTDEQQMAESLKVCRLRKQTGMSQYGYALYEDYFSTIKRSITVKIPEQLEGSFLYNGIPVLVSVWEYLSKNAHKWPDMKECLQALHVLPKE